MTRVCIDCDEEISGRFATCDKCGRYVCNDCVRDTGNETYCKKCFEDER